MNFTGNSTHSKEILGDIIDVINGFRKPIEEVELNRAKNILKRTILNNLTNQGERTEEIARSVLFYLILVQYLRKCSQRCYLYVIH